MVESATHVDCLYHCPAVVADFHDNVADLIRAEQDRDELLCVCNRCLPSHLSTGEKVSNLVFNDVVFYSNVEKVPQHQALSVGD